MSPHEVYQMTDRDLLIELMTEMKAMRQDFLDVKADGYPRCNKHTGRLDSLEEKTRGTRKMLWVSLAVTGVTLIVIGPSHMVEIIKYLAVIF